MLLNNRLLQVRECERCGLRERARRHGRLPISLSRMAARMAAPRCG